MPNYNSLLAADKSAVDTAYRDKVNMLLNMMVNVNTVRLDPNTSPSDAASLDGQYGDLQNRLAMLEREMTQVYGSAISISPPDAPTIAAIQTLAATVDRFNQNQAIASATLNLGSQVLTAATSMIGA